MDAATRNLVRQRAENRCEYCLLSQGHSELTHHIEHIIAKQHGGSDEVDNLALACHRCNLRKGPNVTGIDPATGEIVALFHPRRDEWQRHLRFQGADSARRIVDKSAYGLNAAWSPPGGAPCSEKFR